MEAGLASAMHRWDLEDFSDGTKGGEGAADDVGVSVLRMLGVGHL